MGVMVTADRKSHWDRVYSTKPETGVSWFQDEPRVSLELIRAVAPAQGGRIIDVGGGTSVLVDRLLDLPFAQIAVLDVSQTALDKAKTRLGARAARVRWILADVTEAAELGAFDVWHDRAAFHFLTDAADRKRYIERATRTLPLGGHAIIATFADDGPNQCSDLNVCRYNPASLASELAGAFSLVTATREDHTTPWGSSQPFIYAVLRRK